MRQPGCSSVTLGNSLDLVLLSNAVGVGLTDTLGSGNDLISKSLAHGLVVSEAGLSRSLAHEVDGLVDSSEWRDINGLSLDGTSRSNSGGVLSGSSLDDGIEKNLEWVVPGEKVNKLKSLSEDSHSHLLLTVLSMISNHEHVDESLGDWAVDLLETLFLIFTSSVWDVHLSLSLFDSKVGNEGTLRALDSLIRPLAEKLWGDSKFSLFFHNEFRFLIDQIGRAHV